MGKLVVQAVGPGYDQSGFSIDHSQVLDRIGKIATDQAHRARLQVVLRVEMSDGHADVELGQMYLSQLGLL